MLSKLIIQKTWLIIERLKGEEVAKLNNVELIKEMQEQLNEDSKLTNLEIKEISTYIQSRIPLIRDLAEIELAIQIKNKELVEDKIKMIRNK